MVFGFANVVPGEMPQQPLRLSRGQDGVLSAVMMPNAEAQAALEEHIQLARALDFDQVTARVLALRAQLLAGSGEDSLVHLDAAQSHGNGAAQAIPSTENSRRR